MEKKIIGLLGQAMQEVLLVDMKFLDEKKQEIKHLNEPECVSRLKLQTFQVSSY